MLSTALRYFLEVARTGSLSEASQTLHVTVSAISRQIAKLEDHLGASLFDRHPRGMVLTVSGELLADYARRSALEAERVTAEVRDGLGLRRGAVRVAVSDGVARIAARAVRRFQADHPDAAVDLTVAPSDVVVKQLRRGEVDLGLVFTLLPEADLRIERSWSTYTCVFVRRDHPLAARDSVTIADLDGLKLALPTHNTIARVVALLRVDERRMQASTFTSNSFEIICDYVRSERAVGIASDIAIRSLTITGEPVGDGDRGDESFVTVPFAQPDLHKRTIQLYGGGGRILSGSGMLLRNILASGMDAVVNG
jgi:DNA-binding transcriptional LysR family regulator